MPKHSSHAAPVVLTVFFIGIAWLGSSVRVAAEDLFRSPDQSYHLAIRSDGRPGSGTSADPFDCGATAKFDAVVKNLPADCNIYLGAGTFRTLGVGVKAGQHWRGQGMDITTIQLDPSGPYHYGNGPVVIANSGEDASGAEITDLTADGNQQNLGFGKKLNRDLCLDAVNLAGGAIKIRRVHAINCYGGGKNEEFTLGIDCSKVGTSSDGSEISGCIVDHIPPGYTNGIFMFGVSGKCAGLITGNLVSNLVGGHAYSAGGDGVKIVNNTARNCGCGFYMDTGQFSHARIIGNTFFEVSGPGIMTNFGEPAQREGNLIADNFVEETGKACAILMYSNNNLVVMGNTIKFSGKSLAVTPGLVSGQGIWIGNTVIPGSCTVGTAAMGDGTVNISNLTSAFRTATFGTASPNFHPIGNRSVTIDPPVELPPSPDIIASGVSLTIDGNPDYGAFIGSLKTGDGNGGVGLVLGTRRVGNDANILTLRYGNRVGINNGNPQAVLDVNGTAHVSGALTAGPRSVPVTDGSGKILSAALNTVAVGQGGTGAPDAATARTNLGVRKAWVAAPIHGNDPGQEGDEAFDDAYHYIYHAGKWLRSAAYSSF